MEVERSVTPMTMFYAVSAIFQSYNGGKWSDDLKKRAKKLVTFLKISNIIKKWNTHSIGSYYQFEN